MIGASAVLVLLTTEAVGAVEVFFFCTCFVPIAAKSSGVKSFSTTGPFTVTTAAVSLDVFPLPFAEGPAEAMSEVFEAGGAGAVVDVLPDAKRRWMSRIISDR